MKRIALLLAVIMLASAAGCSPGKAETAQEKYPGYYDIPPVLDAGGAAKDRYNAFLWMYNYSNNRLSLLMDRYLVIFGYDINPVIVSGFNKKIYAPDSGDIGRIKEAVEMAEKSGAVVGVNADAAAFGREMLALCENLEKAHEYLEKRGYKEDGFAQIKASHIDFIDHMNMYFQAYDAFSPKLLALAAVEEKAAPDRYEAAGLTIFSSSQRCYETMKSLLKAIKSEEYGTSAADIALLNADVITPVVESLEAELAGLVAAAADEDELKKEGLSKEETQDFAAALEKVAQNGRNLLKNISDGKQFSPEEIKNAVKTPGTPESLRLDVASAIMLYGGWFKS